jgi:hypothetical protein
MSFGRFLFWFGIIPAGIALTVTWAVERDALATSGDRHVHALIATVAIPGSVLLLSLLGYGLVRAFGREEGGPLLPAWAEALLVVLAPWVLFIILMLEERRRKHAPGDKWARPMLLSLLLLPRFEIALWRRRQVAKHPERPLPYRDLWRSLGRLCWFPVVLEWTIVVIGLCVSILLVTSEPLFGVVALLWFFGFGVLTAWETRVVHGLRREHLSERARLHVVPPPEEPADAAAEIDWTTPLLSPKARKAREEKLRREAGAEESSDADG